MTDTAYISVNVTAVNKEPTLIINPSLLQMTEGIDSNFSIFVNDTDCVNTDCNLTIIIESNSEFTSIYPSICSEITSGSFVSSLSLNANVSEINQCLRNISVSFDSDINGIFRNVKLFPIKRFIYY